MDTEALEDIQAEAQQDNGPNGVALKAVTLEARTLAIEAEAQALEDIEALEDMVALEDIEALEDMVALEEAPEATLQARTLTGFMNRNMKAGNRLTRIMNHHMKARTLAMDKNMTARTLTMDKNMKARTLAMEALTMEALTMETVEVTMEALTTIKAQGMEGNKGMVHF